MTSTAAFLVYAFWVLATPFYDQDHFVVALFPRPELAIAAPLVLAATAAAFVLSFLALVMVRGRPRALPPAEAAAAALAARARK